MTPPANLKKEEYAKTVCLFLAELLRTRRITLARCAEIAQKVIEHLNLIDSEENFLRLVKELTSDFEELYQLEKIVVRRMEINQRDEMEEQVRAFVIWSLIKDIHTALSVLKEAMKEESQLNSLYEKFPQFKEFIQHHEQH